MAVDATPASDSEFIAKVMKLYKYAHDCDIGGCWDDPPTREQRMVTRVRHAVASRQGSWVFRMNADDTFPAEDLHNLHTISVDSDSSYCPSTCPWLKLPNTIDRATIACESDERVLAVCHFIEAHTALKSIRLTTLRSSLLEGLPSLISRLGAELTDCKLELVASSWTYSVDKALKSVVRQLKSLYLQINFGYGAYSRRQFTKDEPSMLTNCAIGLSDNERLESLTLAGFNAAETVDVLSCMPLHTDGVGAPRQPLAKFSIHPLVEKHEHMEVKALAMRLGLFLPCYKATLTHVTLSFTGLLVSALTIHRPYYDAMINACSVLLSEVSHAIEKCKRLIKFILRGLLSRIGNSDSSYSHLPWSYMTHDWALSMQRIYACANIGFLQEIQIGELTLGDAPGHRRAWPNCAMGLTYPLERLLANAVRANQQDGLWARIAFRVSVERAARNHFLANSVFSRFIEVDEPSSSSSSSSSTQTTQTKVKCVHNIEHHIYSFMGMPGGDAHVYYSVKNTTSDISSVMWPNIAACGQCGAKAQKSVEAQNLAVMEFARDCCVKFMDEDRKNGNVWTTQVTLPSVESDDDDVMIVDQPPAAAAAGVLTETTESRVYAQPVRRAKRRYADDVAHPYGV
jgi:hypothetical protein